MNETKATISKPKGQDNWIITATGYDDEEIKDKAEAIETYMLRANPYIGLQLKNLLRIRKYDRDWADALLRGAMIADRGLVLKPTMTDPVVVAELPDYETPHWSSITHRPNEKRWAIICDCEDWKSTQVGHETSMKEMLVAPMTHNNIFCKHVIAYLMIANSPIEMGTESPVAEQIAIILVSKIKFRYAADLGASNLPMWLKEVWPIEVKGRDTLNLSLPGRMIGGENYTPTDGQQLQEKLGQMYPKLDLQIGMITRQEDE